MNRKRIPALLLALALLLTLPVFPRAQARSAVSTFDDISDPAEGEAADLLRLLGIVQGVGGNNFEPAEGLTRAEFCTLAVKLRGEESKAAAQARRTIFSDVTARHWAVGYVNYASTILVGSDSERLIQGVGDGSFRPDRPISQAEAITLCVRTLDYSLSDVPAGGLWYDGYLTIAEGLHLTTGLTLDPDLPITRGEAAILFRNMLYAAPRGTDTTYFASLGCSLTDEGILLDPDAVTADGERGIVVTDTDGEPLPPRECSAADTFPVGTRVKLMLDRDGRVLGVQEGTKVSLRTLTLSGAEATYFRSADGAKISLRGDTVVYAGGEKTTYAAVYLELVSGQEILLAADSAGKVEYLILELSGTAENGTVLQSDGLTSEQLLALTGSTDCRIVRSGAPCTAADARAYDVATYDAVTRTLYLCDLRLTGIYSDAAPSPRAPERVTVLGIDFPVLPGAEETLAQTAPGSAVTLLFTYDGQVAAACDPRILGSNLTCIAETVTTTAATVVPLSPLRDADGKDVVFTGAVSYSSAYAKLLQGKPVVLSSDKAGSLTLTRVSEATVPGDLSVSTRTIGGEALSAQTVLYERIGTGRVSPISWEQITCAAVPASAISFASRGSDGKIDFLLLDDVTGDLWHYGIASSGEAWGGGSMGTPFSNPTVIVDDGLTALECISSTRITKGSFLGLAASGEEIEGVPKAAGIRTLESISGVERGALRLNTGSSALAGSVTVGGVTFPIAGNVRCYNAVTGTWFADLAACRAYADTVTLCYDRTPAEGGKVRIIVVG